MDRQEGETVEAGGGEGDPEESSAGGGGVARDGAPAQGKADANEVDVVAEEEEEVDVPEELEDIVEALLCGLRDRDTVVRWSAAKGIGRITERLPRELGTSDWRGWKLGKTSSVVCRSAEPCAGPGGSCVVFVAIFV